MTETIHGACLCGQVTFELREPAATGYCHCTRCQRWTGGPGLPEVEVAATDFEITAGEELVRRFEEEGFSSVAFCSTCGSSLYAYGDDRVYVSAGVLQGFSFEPEYHMMVAYKAPWDAIADDAPQHPEWPPAS